MKKARMKDGGVVLARQYNDKKNQDEQLFCADRLCGAEMLFRREGLTRGSLTLRSACFVSKKVEQHVAGCTAYENLAIQAKRRKSIEEGLHDNMVILINLNVSMTEAFNQASRGGGIAKRSTREISNYVTVPAKSIEDLMNYKTYIEKLAGDDGLAKTRVNYKGKTMPINEFILDTQEKFQAMLDKMQEDLAKNPSTEEAIGFPRLLAFKSVPIKGYLKGSPVTLHQPNGKNLAVFQNVQAPSSLRRALRGNKVLLLGVPRLNRVEAQKTLARLEKGHDKTVMLDIHWKITDQRQFMLQEDTYKPQQNTLKF